jgi:hypothetical protein
MLSNEVNTNLNVENNLDSVVSLKANRFALINFMSHNEGSSALPIAVLLLIVLFSYSMISHVGSFFSFVYSIPSIIYAIILLVGCGIILCVYLAA